jgi:putative ABC transport system ATP-binding protein
VSGPLIALRDVHKVYRAAGPGEPAVPVLRGVDLTIAEGEMVALTGASGSGKSTLLNVIGGLDRDVQGEVRVDGAPLTALDDRALSAFRNRTVGFIFQQFHLLPHLSVAANVALPRWFDRGAAGSDALSEAREALDRVGLAHKASARPSHLSGGEKQRVAIARALFNRPRILLCDEPTGALDSANAARVFELIAELNRAARLTVVLVTHEAALAARCPRRVTLRDGCVLTDEARGAVGPVSPRSIVAPISPTA